jgi:hemerythrin
VDAQHQELFRMVNDLHDAIVAGKGKDVLQPTLEKLAKYTMEHFRSEEALMAEIKYPALGTHKNKHDELTRQVKELVEKYRTGKAVLGVTLSSFLADWLRHHIKEDDMALIKYTQTHPVALTAKSGG